MIKNIFRIILFAIVIFYTHKVFAAIVINEFLADPPLGLTGDANQDGVRNPTQDEFIELLNTGSLSVDISQWSLFDGTRLRQLFSNGAVLAPYERAVIFGGGKPTSLNGFITTASTGELNLNNTGDDIVLKNGLGETIDFVHYGNEGNLHQSLTRFPEGAGAFYLHSTVSSNGLLFSPGKDIDGYSKNHIPSAPEIPTSLLLAIGFALSIINVKIPCSGR